MNTNNNNNKPNYKVEPIGKRGSQNTSMSKVGPSHNNQNTMNNQISYQNHMQPNQNQLLPMSSGMSMLHQQIMPNVINNDINRSNDGKIGSMQDNNNIGKGNNTYDHLKRNRNEIENCNGSHLKDMKDNKLKINQKDNLNRLNNDWDSRNFPGKKGKKDIDRELEKNEQSKNKNNKQESNISKNLNDSLNNYKMNKDSRINTSKINKDPIQDQKHVQSNKITFSQTQLIDDNVKLKPNLSQYVVKNPILNTSKDTNVKLDDTKLNLNIQKNKNNENFS